jgi:hypothetical protein
MQFDGLYYFNQSRDKNGDVKRAFTHLLIFTKKDDWLEAYYCLQSNTLDPSNIYDYNVMKSIFELVQLEYNAEVINASKINLQQSLLLEKISDQKYTFEIVTGLQGVFKFDLEFIPNGLVASLNLIPFVTKIRELVFEKKKFKFYPMNNPVRFY